MTQKNPIEYIIKLRSVPWNKDDRPPIVRLRSLLKLMLRGFGFRCVEIGETEGEDPTDELAKNAE